MSNQNSQAPRRSRAASIRPTPVERNGAAAAAPLAKAPSPLGTLLSVWILSAGMIAVGIITYNGIPRDSAGLLYLAGALLCFVCGFGLALRRRIGKKVSLLTQPAALEAWRTDVLRLGRYVDVFAISGLFASVLFAVEMLFIVGIQPSDLLATRVAFESRNVTLLSQLASVLGAGGYLSLVSAILCWERLSGVRKFLWLTSPLSLSAFSLLSAGRQTVTHLALIVLFSLMLKGVSFRPHFRTLGSTIRLGVVLLAVVIYAMIVSNQRTDVNRQSKKDLLLTWFHADLLDGLHDRLDALPPVLRDGSVELLVYFTHPIPNFVLFYELPRPGPYFGLWELPFMSRRLESLGLAPGTVGERIDYVYWLFSESGRSPQVWQTTVRDMMIDFGDVGALLVMLAAGYVCGRIYFRVRTHGGLVYAYLLVGVNLCCAYSVLSAAYSDTLVFFYFVTSILLWWRCERRPRPVPSNRQVGSIGNRNPARRGGFTG